MGRKLSLEFSISKVPHSSTLPSPNPCWLSLLCMLRAPHNYSFKVLTTSYSHCRRICLFVPHCVSVFNDGDWFFVISVSPMANGVSDAWWLVNEYLLNLTKTTNNSYHWVQLLCTSHCFKGFTSINPFNPLYNPIQIIHIRKITMKLSKYQVNSRL